MHEPENPYQNEHIVDYGATEKDGEVVPFVITETRLPFDKNQCPRQKYVGENIPEVFLTQVKRLIRDNEIEKRVEEFRQSLINPPVPEDIKPDSKSKPLVLG